MIVDTFLFNNEFDMLDIHLEISKNYVDKWIVLEADRTLSGLKKEFHLQKNIQKYKEKYKDRLIPIQGYSYAVANQISNSSLDLVFIDADHSYSAVKQDILAYMPKLKEHGILSGHDIDYPGVNKAVTELIPSFDVGPNNVWIKHKGNI